ncbi:MAG: hypothetical protein AAGI51_03575 [Pseudomonadota bacterium]
MTVEAQDGAEDPARKAGGADGPPAEGAAARTGPAPKTDAAPRRDLQPYPTGPEPAGLVVTAPVSPGELIDKITILEIKCARIPDAAKRALAADELALLARTRDQAIPASEALDDLTADLRAVNEDLWTIEDDLRRFEAQGEFGPAFIALARSVYRLNDRRAARKREINTLLGARLHEVKSHPDYD